MFQSYNHPQGAYFVYFIKINLVLWQHVMCYV